MTTLASRIRQSARLTGSFTLLRQGQRHLLRQVPVRDRPGAADALGKLKADGFVPTAALCVIDRETGGKQALATAGLELRALLTFSQVENAGIAR